MRNVILHMHLPKTGGTTLSVILNRELGDRHHHLSFFRLKKPDELGNTHMPWKHILHNDSHRIRVDRDQGNTHMPWKRVLHKYGMADLEPDWDFREADLVDVLERNMGISAISRHGMVIGPSTIEAMMAETGDGLDCRILPVFFLRKFFSWHASLYFQQRRDPEYMVRLSCDPEVMVAKTGTLKEYTRYCVGSPDSRRRHKMMYNWTADDADRMLARIELYQIGLMERYNESLVVMEEALGEYFPGLDLSYGSPLNVDGHRRGGTAAQRVRDLERDIGRDLAEDLAEMGAWSDDLYDKIDEELDSRVSRMSNFRGKLDDFESRCRTRSGVALSGSAPATRRVP